MTGPIMEATVNLTLSKNSILREILESMKVTEQFYPLRLRGTPDGVGVRPRWRRKAIQEASAKKGLVSISEYRRGLLVHLPEVMISASRSEEGVVHWELSSPTSWTCTIYPLSLPKEEP